jgi:GNAT superfamily N-acetyltransferase
MAQYEGEVIGFALYFFNFSTWLGKPGLYLEDLYVTPEARRKGAGKALLSELAKIAEQKNCGRFEWSVLDWNQPAIDFYESLGAAPQSEWTIFRLTASGISNLAKAY